MMRMRRFACRFTIPDKTKTKKSSDEGRIREDDMTTLNNKKTGQKNKEKSLNIEID